jgi:hypothetical protein
MVVVVVSVGSLLSTMIVRREREEQEEEEEEEGNHHLRLVWANKVITVGATTIRGGNMGRIFVPNLFWQMMPMVVIR